MPLLAPMSDNRAFAVIVLAAGQGTRMRSDTHKVLHPIASRPLLLHLLDRVDALGAERRVVVLGKGREQVEAAIAERDTRIAIQAEQRGTGHAVQQAEKALEGYDGPILILMATRRSFEARTFADAIARRGRRPGIVVLASRQTEPRKRRIAAKGTGSANVEYREDRGGAGDRL